MASDSESSIAELKGDGNKLEAVERQKRVNTGTIIKDLNSIFNEDDKSIESSTNTVQTLTLNGLTFVPKRGKGRTKKTLLHPKIKRKDLTEEQRMKLIETIQSKQQTKYHAITISINDPEKMTTTYSLANLLKENQRNLAKYDLLDPYNIIYPETGCFEEFHPNEGTLRTDTGTEGYKTSNLFADYLRITPESVAASSKYYSIFVPDDHRYQEDLEWSLAYYEKNVEPDLYSKVYSTMMRYETDAHGGPLFLKLLLDRVTTSGESTLKALQNTLRTYVIKSSCPGEDVEKVAEIFAAVIDNIDALSNGTLPAETVSDLLNLFQTTSVPAFNTKFERLSEDLSDAEINDEIDLNYRLRESNTSALSNDRRSADYVLHYAERTYRRLVKNGKWDACLQRLPGKAGFVMQQPDKFVQDAKPPPTNNGGGGACFNCGSTEHRLQQCPLPRDEARIAKNKANHPTWSRILKQKEKWQPPKAHENNKRVIDGKPHTYDPKGGRLGRGRWIEDITPSDGQPNGGSPPTVALAASDLSNDISSVTGPITFQGERPPTTKHERKIYYHMMLENARNELASLG